MVKRKKIVARMCFTYGLALSIALGICAFNDQSQTNSSSPSSSESVNDIAWMNIVEGPRYDVMNATTEKEDVVEPEPTVVYNIMSDTFKIVGNGRAIVDIYDSATEDNIIGFACDGDVITGVVEDAHIKINVDDIDAFVRLSDITPHKSIVNLIDYADVTSKNFTGSTIVTSSSGLSREDIDYLIEDSYIEGMGTVFHDCEVKYGINAYFCLAVAKIESGWGSSDAGLYYNNLFGIMGSTSIKFFSSKEECVVYWFELISDYYINNNYTTPETIGVVYCDSGWSPVVVDIMNQLADTMAERQTS